MEDARALIYEAASPAQVHEDWHDSERDPEALYTAHYRIDAGTDRPLMVYTMLNDAHARDAIASLLKFETWGTPLRALGVFHDSTAANPKVVARTMDVCDRTFSSLGGNHDRIVGHIAEQTDVA